MRDDGMDGWLECAVWKVHMTNANKPVTKSEGHVPLGRST